jgi:hypothetical protein
VEARGYDEFVLFGEIFKIPLLRLVYVLGGSEVVRYSGRCC